jgi:hypothetical protein
MISAHSPKSGDTSKVVKVRMCCHMPMHNCLRCSNTLQRTLKVPEHPKINLPTRPSVPTLGTKASDILDMDLQSNTQQNIQLQIDAYKERERLEEEGIGDRLSELQQFTWKIFDGSKLKSSPWEIDILCEYTDDECEQMYV